MERPIEPNEGQSGAVDLQYWVCLKVLMQGFLYEITSEIRDPEKTYSGLRIQVSKKALDPGS